MGTGPFTFQASPTFVQAGYESATGEWAEDRKQEIRTLRANYPELAGWGDLAIGTAWDNFSQDVVEVGWCEWLVQQRDELFLNYCFWRQTHGKWNLGWDDGNQASGWKQTPAQAEA